METCFSYNDGKCRVLAVYQCLGICAFYKTVKQVSEGSQRSDLRLASFDPVHQRYIAEKYYKGKMPWLRGGVAV